MSLLLSLLSSSSSLSLSLLLLLLFLFLFFLLHASGHQWPPRHHCHNVSAVICRDALVQGPPGLTFVAYGNSTSVTTGYGVATSVPLLPCTSISNVSVHYLVHPLHLACDQQLPAPETCIPLHSISSVLYVVHPPLAPVVHQAC